MTTEEIVRFIANEGSLEFKCYDTLIKLLNENEEFKNIITEGIQTGKITGFSPELWEKLGLQNMRSRGYDSFLDVFRLGQNQGNCTPASKQVSYSLDTCDICGGVLPILAGTSNCIDGSHTWIETPTKIIDTTLLMEIDVSFKSKMGYIEENRYNPNTSPLYCSAKEFTNDPSFRKHR